MFAKIGTIIYSFHEKIEHFELVKFNKLQC